MQPSNPLISSVNARIMMLFYSLVIGKCLEMPRDLSVRLGQFCLQWRHLMENGAFCPLTTFSQHITLTSN